MKYSMTCTCGDVMSVDASMREDAVTQLRNMMTPEMIAAHMSEKHSGEPVPSQEQVYAMIEQGTREG